MANSGTKLHGKNGAIYIGGAKGSGGIKVAVKAEWTLQRNRDYIDATVFGDSNKTYLAGLPNTQGTFSGFFDTSGDLLNNAAASDARKAQVRTVDRSERIRTYSFPQNRITDYRIGYTAYNLDLALAGELDGVLDALTEADRAARLAGETELSRR